MAATAQSTINRMEKGLCAPPLRISKTLKQTISKRTQIKINNSIHGSETCRATRGKRALLNSIKNAT